MFKKYDYLVYILRAEPFTEAHRLTIEKALSLSDRVIALIGSSFAPRDLRNPFTWQERALMIRGSFPTDKLFIEPIRDYPYNDDIWTSEIQNAVYNITSEVENPSVILV